MSTARPDAWCITMVLRLFWKLKQEGFLGCGQCNHVCRDGFSLMVKALPFPSPAETRGGLQVK